MRRILCTSHLALTAAQGSCDTSTLPCLRTQAAAVLAGSARRFGLLADVWGDAPMPCRAVPSDKSRQSAVSAAEMRSSSLDYMSLPRPLKCSTSTLYTLLSPLRVCSQALLFLRHDDTASLDVALLPTRPLGKIPSLEKSPTTKSWSAVCLPTLAFAQAARKLWTRFTQAGQECELDIILVPPIYRLAGAVK